MNKSLERKDQLFKGDLGGALSFEMKDVSESGEFEGYASHFNVIDQGDDMMLPGAFKDSLAVTPAEKVRMLYHHDPREVVGKYSEMREDDTGLYIKGRLFLKLQRAQEIHELMKEKALEGLSIGYRTKEFSYEKDSSVRKLIAVDLREVSIVTFPMEELAGITLVKNAGTLPTEREFERYLTRDAGYSVQQAKAIIASGYKSLLNAARDAGQDSDQSDLTRIMKEATALLRA